MKKVSIVIDGQHEEEIGLEILQGIYAAIQIGRASCRERV